MTQNAIVEFIGAFPLVLVVDLTAGRTDFAPIAIGLTLMVMVYMGGHISGGHYSPAVTLGCLMRGATRSLTGSCSLSAAARWTPWEKECPWARHL